MKTIYDISLDVNYLAFLRPVRIVRREKIYNIIPTTVGAYNNNTLRAWHVRMCVRIVFKSTPVLNSQCTCSLSQYILTGLYIYIIWMPIYCNDTMADILYNYILHVRRIYLRIDNNIIVIGVGVRYYIKII